MAERDYNNINFRLELADQLHETGLVLPSIRISDVLHTRMKRHQRTIIFDEINMMDGVREIENERPAVLYFDSQSKKNDSLDPEISFT